LVNILVHWVMTMAWIIWTSGGGRTGSDFRPWALSYSSSRGPYGLRVGCQRQRNRFIGFRKGLTFLDRCGLARRQPQCSRSGRHPLHRDALAVRAPTIAPRQHQSLLLRSRSRRTPPLGVRAMLAPCPIRLISLRCAAPLPTPPKGSPRRPGSKWHRMLSVKSSMPSKTASAL